MRGKQPIFQNEVTGKMLRRSAFSSMEAARPEIFHHVMASDNGVLHASATFSFGS
jgi:hypothetical protein